MYSKLLSMLQLSCLKDAWFCFSFNRGTQTVRDSFENHKGYMFSLPEIWAPGGSFLLVGSNEQDHKEPNVQSPGWKTHEDTDFVPASLLCFTFCFQQIFI